MLTDPSRGLRDAPLMFLFLETPDLARQRALLEGVLALPLIENQFHPPHSRHGLYKYDAGNLVVALNLAAERRFSPADSDALVSEVRVPWEPGELTGRLRGEGFAPPNDAFVFTDNDGHHHAFYHDPAATRVTVESLRLLVDDLPPSIDYFGRILGLELLECNDRTASFATGTIPLTLEAGRSAPGGQRPRRDSYLCVFHTPDIRAAFAALRDRGVAFKADHPGFSQIGGTARFADPSGHTFCLYEPSNESLTWDSGPKVRALAATPVGRR